jgi:hypothetical protein
MANTPTKRTRMAKQGTGDNPNAWGVWLNESGLDIIDESWGTAEVAVSGDVVLDAQDFTTDEARRFVVIMTGTGGSVTAPAVDKPYLVDNRCSGAVIFKPFAGTGVSIPAGATALVFANAAGDTFWAAGVASSRSGGAFNLFGNPTTNAAAATTPTGLTTKDQVEDMMFNSPGVGLPPPTGHAGEVVGTPDGLTYQFMKALPDATGQDDKVLGVVGGAVGWVKRNGLVLISEQVVTTPVASVDFTAGIDASYDEYEFHLYNIIPDTDGTNLWFRTSSNGGTNFDNGASDYTLAGVSSSAQIALTGALGNAAGENGASGVVRLFRPAVAQALYLALDTVSANTAGLIQGSNGKGGRNAVAVVNAVRFLLSSGNIQSGSFRLYGVSK